MRAGLWLTLTLPLLGGCGGSKPEGLGPVGERLALCGNKPNCVCSFETRPEFQVAPLKLALPEQNRFAPVKAVLGRIGEHKLAAEGPNYLHVVFVSRWFRFKDDLEFLYLPDQQILHLRSASRVGYGDLGVNRKRTETLRALLSP
ncbi:MAG: hypothetical protein A2600_11665 [Candidatus Lambdaproteobacteria bacterium RIFOXYD1_FULL_56_27]|uniref:DUF1499 domain-containing protein n=1 Tax=Candidatus Lambdaproteobacteria bacterium RIFOXYD2_FULL_56_26 TaxID=1817773 RepID=A0A1F6GYK4_9PROT|nr:MAG: hypothetical protein A2426_06295 [Candidatus Lambdaproteobacteria bacterium RIFOXYC1_FULL_56_13]OGH03253.1 MAG: hypothetical protein A2557_00840 [Candidatus Lambdaproteobacteria bacterium RIFOXYD2_FULL_56_26]OGH08190.1 MAG: hypothetical protein A2600_11665 [Candidatus Lambdaproteobacteria bacterium RIFOXYD1_FULL_56_27]